MNEKKTIELFTKKSGDFVSSNYICLNENDLVVDAVKRAVDQNKETILAQNKNDEIIGIVTLKDIFKKFVPKFGQEIKIKDIMTSPVIYVNMSDLLFMQ